MSVRARLVREYIATHGRLSSGPTSGSSRPLKSAAAQRQSVRPLLTNETCALESSASKMVSMTDEPLRLDDAVAILERTPATLSALLKGLPETWVHATEGAGTWSPFDVIGHLIHGERTDWIPRARHIMAGDSRPFQAFDRTAQFMNSQGKSLGELPFQVPESGAARRYRERPEEAVLSFPGRSPL
jgi:hypothetical protein